MSAAKNKDSDDWESASFSFHTVDIDGDRKTLGQNEEDEKDMQIVFRDNDTEDLPGPEVRGSTRLQNYFTRRRTWAERFQDWFSCLRTYKEEDDDEVEIPRKNNQKD
ncbi:hypothetical protein PRIPAC_70036 [Pristionchus pacificus]|uniref:Uncharacterized protein n=1 Tax=Pristionchus pacificus TaxID=54126 RepID=A0A2A6BG65_PRIPA|nr:hypothetical protein PRIPAC_70036 [Pristionchus pacificus]|eukprot:PDM64846.1 hypothetical protein PRIPAC_53102 [Pristionchus pacificus]